LAELLYSGIRELGEVLDVRRSAQLVALTESVSRWNRRMNLTGHRDAEAVMRRLVLDAVALLHRAVELTDASSVVDLGSGAGFPGLPIAILEPDWRVVLVDSRERRHHFQRSIRRELGLANLEARLGRAEVVAPTPSDLVVAQAMGTATQVLEWALPWSCPGGLILIPGGEKPPSPGQSPKLEESGVATYQVPLHGPARTLWWGRVGRA
jgi:16S rRNA (guanine527-N7)-methyltransferase